MALIVSSNGSLNGPHAVNGKLGFKCKFTSGTKHTLINSPTENGLLVFAIYPQNHKNFVAFILMVTILVYICTYVQMNAA